MWAVEVSQFGGPDELRWRELPDLTAGPGQAVIQVSDADVLFVDTQVRAGRRLGGYCEYTPPYVPGDGVAGRVVSVGSTADRNWMDRRVVARTGGTGGYAQQALAPVDALVNVPDEVSSGAAAALIHDGPTALRIFERTAIRPAEAVLVLAAAGGLGCLLVQLARAADAHVIAAVRGPGKVELARRLGADVVVDYADPDWSTDVLHSTLGAGADVVFDGVGGPLGLSAFEVTARCGLFSAHGAAGGSFAQVDPERARRRGITLVGIEQARATTRMAPALIDRALTQAAAGRLSAVVGQTFPLACAADAHSAIASRGVIGKTLLVA
jgi:NADPH2:quinone reductase